MLAPVGSFPSVGDGPIELGVHAASGMGLASHQLSRQAARDQVAKERQSAGTIVSGWSPTSPRARGDRLKADRSPLAYARAPPGL